MTTKHKDSSSSSSSRSPVCCRSCKINSVARPAQEKRREYFRAAMSHRFNCIRARGLRQSVQSSPVQPSRVQVKMCARIILKEENILPPSHEFFREPQSFRLEGVKSSPMSATNELPPPPPSYTARCTTMTTTVAILVKPTGLYLHRRPVPI